MKKKSTKKIIAGMLLTCFIAESAMPGIQVEARGRKGYKEGAAKRAVENALSNNLTMEEAEKGLHRNDKRDDDGDGLLNYWEDSIGTDKTNPDTDGDGLTDYEEVVLTGTDPLLADTNGDGILDGDEDSDMDGLTNKEELKLGSNPLMTDTDEDGLSDFEEVKVYGTNPTIYDTDKDGASDGFEVEKMKEGNKEFNPLVANKKMKQHLAEETKLEETPQILSSKKQSRTYDPATADSDHDGIPDAQDSAPYERGLKGGIVGSLQLVGSHNPDAAFTEGHSFLVYTSYVDGQAVNITNLYGSHNFNKAEYAEGVSKNEKLLSWRSLVDQCTLENDAERKVVADSMWPVNNKGVTSYQLHRGDYLSIGNFTENSYTESLKDGFLNAEKGTLAEVVALQALYEMATGKKVDALFIMTHLEEVTKLLAFKSYIKQEDVINGKTDGGIWINREMYDQRYQYDQYPHEIYKVEITQPEFNNMMAALNSNNYYSMLNHNCSSVSSLVWNATVGYKTDISGNYQTDKKGNRIKSDLYVSGRGKGALSILDFPGAVCEGIVSLRDNGASRGSYYSKNSEIVQGENVYKR